MASDLPLIDRHTAIRDAIRIIADREGDAAIITGESGALLGVESIGDLRRLLVSGADETDEVGAHASPAPTSFPAESLRDRDRVEAQLAEMRLGGYRYVPVVNAAGDIQEIVSIVDLEQTLGGIATPGDRAESTRRILVVGGGGYLGSVLTRALLAKGYAVRVLDSFLYGRRALDEIASDSRLEIVEGDIRNIHTCVTALHGVDGVVLLAAIVGDPASKVRPSETIETNVLATQALATACKLQHISRFIYASTCSVYGTGDGLLDENSPLSPVSLYARTKIASERILQEMGNEYFRPTILRMGTLYGYSPRMRFDLVVNTMVMKSFVDRKIFVFGGEQWRPLLHVADAADVYVACLEANIDTVGNQVFNVGSDEQNYQIDQIAKTVSQSLGDVAIERDSSSPDARDYRVSFGKIQTAVGFRPRQSVEASAREIYDALAGGSIQDPAQRIYYNHYFDSAES